MVDYTAPGLQVGKKKTQDVQFYTEVMEVNQAIDAGRRSMYDPDELEEEQRERETRNRVSNNGHSCALRALPPPGCAMADSWQALRLLLRGHEPLQYRMPARHCTGCVAHKGRAMTPAGCCADQQELPPVLQASGQGRLGAGLPVSSPSKCSIALARACQQP